MNIRLYLNLLTLTPYISLSYGKYFVNIPDKERVFVLLSQADVKQAPSQAETFGTSTKSRTPYGHL
jgi:hypothetical protein